MYGTYLKYVNDRLFEVLRSYPPQQMIIPKKHESKIDQKLLGLYVDHYGGTNVLREDNRLLICREVEDAQIIEEYDRN